MTMQDAVRKAVRTMARFDRAHNGVWVTTHCLYPSNSWVRVLVRGEANEFLVSDEGGAVDEVTSIGLAFPDAERSIRRMARRQGLKVAKGQIYSPSVGVDGIGAAVILVANVSKEAAHWGVEHMGFGTPRNFRVELTKLIEGLVGCGIQHQQDGHLVGASNKPHRFEHVIRLSSRLILIDPVMNDASSINAKVVAHLDVRHAEHLNLDQRLVYDDQAKWLAADLNLLRVGATPVPFSQMPEVLPRLVA
jgi:hypothetical protein